jgi:hypothetical protein
VIGGWGFSFVVIVALLADCEKEERFTGLIYLYMYQLFLLLERIDLISRIMEQLPRHVLLTKNCIESLRKTKKEEIDELNT